MPFDPSVPATNAELTSAMFREQFTGLQSLIAAVPGITDVQVDSVTTVNPSDPATASASIVGTVLHLSFSLPQGFAGMQGPPGAPGSNGNDGGPGPQGPKGDPFANAIVDSVVTLPAGSQATVNVMFDGSSVRFSFGIPAGADGANGINGIDGVNGADGAPGEVTNAQLAAAIATTSSNTNAVQTLDTPFTNDPPTLADMELMRAKYNELVLAQRRP